MAKRIRITLAQVMAILALFGILLSVVGTAWISVSGPTPSTVDPSSQIISGEVAQQDPAVDSQ